VLTIIGMDDPRRDLASRPLLDPVIFLAMFVGVRLGWAFSGLPEFIQR